MDTLTHPTEPALPELGQSAVTLPDPVALETALTHALRAGVAAAREVRGEVGMPDDTHDLIRNIYAGRARVQALVDVLLRVIGLADRFLVDEMVTALGADDHDVPVGNMAVPYGDRVIRLDREFDSVYATDRGQILAGTVTAVLQNWRADGEDPAENLEVFGLELLQVLLDDVMCKADPRVQGVKALAQTLEGAHGDAKRASAVRSAHVRTGRRFKRIKTYIADVKPTETAAAGTIGRRR